MTDRVRLLNEVAKKVVDEVLDATDMERLPFDNIFEKNLRILVPLEKTGSYNLLKKELEKIPGFLKIDTDKKEVVRNVVIKRPGYEPEHKVVSINIGKAIANLKISPEVKKELLNWYANYNSNISEMENLSKYSIVLSRHPIDIVRMSDIGGIRSCHAPGREYFQCAIQEGKSGGPIAYLVRTDDLDEHINKLIESKKVTDFQDGLNHGELFKDGGRGIKGVVAIGRIRIRRYSGLGDLSGKDIAIPEKRIYGTRVAGFYDAVRSFLKEKQQYYFETTEDGEGFKNIGYELGGDWERRGGSYTDSSDSELFNNFFNTEVFFGSVTHADEDSEGEAGDRVDQFEEELEGMKNLYARGLKHSDVNYDVAQSDDYVYYNAWGGISIDIGEFLNTNDYDEDFFKELASCDSPEDFASLKRYNFDVKKINNSHYKPSFDYSFLSKLCCFLRHVQDSDTKLDLRSYVSMVSFNLETMTLYFSYSVDDEGGSADNTDDFGSLCRYVKNIDNDFEVLKKEVYRSLISCNLIKQSENFIYSSIVDEKVKFSNLQLDGDSLYSDTYHITKIPDTFSSTLKDIILEKIDKYITKYYKQKEKGDQLNFKSFMESYVPRVLPFDLALSIEHWRYEDSVRPHNLSISFEVTVGPDTTVETLDVIKFFDSSIDDFVNIAKVVAWENIENTGITEEEVSTLKKMYKGVF